MFSLWMPSRTGGLKIRLILTKIYAGIIFREVKMLKFEIAGCMQFIDGQLVLRKFQGIPMAKATPLFLP